MSGSDDVLIRIEGRAGRITLNRPDALNALTWDMCLAIEKALDDWHLQDDVQVVLIDGAPGRAFCAGGDIVAMHRAGVARDWGYGRHFWTDEYRLNARIARYSKPVVTFLHGFTMGGGVGVGCHASHRVVDGTSRIAMPECGIGLVPDVGASMLLARAPGRLGSFLSLTGHRMGLGDAVLAGFADHVVPEGWDALKAELAQTGDAGAVAAAASPAPEAPLAAWLDEIDALLAGETLAEVADAAEAGGGPAAAVLRDALGRAAPLSMACALEILRRLGDRPTIEAALAMEARFTFRAAEKGDFVEGIRAQVIDRDRTPRWRHASPRDVTPGEVEAMLAPLGGDAPELEGWG